MKKTFTRAIIILKSNLIVKLYVFLFIAGIGVTLVFKEPAFNFFFIFPTVINFSKIREMYATRPYTQSERFLDITVVAIAMLLIHAVIIALTTAAFYYLKGPEFFIGEDVKAILVNYNYNMRQVGLEAIQNFLFRSGILLLLAMLYCIYEGTRTYRIRLTTMSEISQSLLRLLIAIGLVGLSIIITKSSLIRVVLSIVFLLISIDINNRISKHQYDVI